MSPFGIAYRIKKSNKANGEKEWGTITKSKGKICIFGRDLHPSHPGRVHVIWSGLSAQACLQQIPSQARRDPEGGGRDPPDRPAGPGIPQSPPPQDPLPPNLACCKNAFGGIIFLKIALSAAGGIR